jgi:hypothetical protein
MIRRAFEVIGSHGELQISMDGSVRKGQTYDGLIITRIDVEEYLKWYGMCAMPECVDIIDVGYWYLVEGCMEGYEPPVDDMRQKKVQINLNRETAFDIAGLISGWLRNPPKEADPRRKSQLQAAYRDLIQEANNIAGPRV